MNFFMDISICETRTASIMPLPAAAKRLRRALAEAQLNLPSYIEVDREVFPIPRNTSIVSSGSSLRAELRWIESGLLQFSGKIELLPAYRLYFQFVLLLGGLIGSALVVISGVQLLRSRTLGNLEVFCAGLGATVGLFLFVRGLALVNYWFTKGQVPKIIKAFQAFPMQD